MNIGIICEREVQGLGFRIQGLGLRVYVGFREVCKLMGYFQGFRAMSLPTFGGPCRL